MSLPLYERDFYAWAMAQSELLRQQRFDELDMEYLIDEPNPGCSSALLSI